RKHWLVVASIYVLFFLCLMLLYRMFGNHKVQLYNPWLTVARLLAPEPGTELFPFLFFGRAVTQLVVLYSFHGAILYWVARKRPALKQTCWFLFLLVISGAVGWGVLYLYIDGIQFFVSILTVAQTLVLISGLCLLSSIGRIPQLLIVVYIAGTAFLNFFHFYVAGDLKAPLSYSKSYLDRINAFSPKSEVGISIESKKDFETNWGIRNVMAHALGDMYVIFMPQYMKAVAINVFAVPETRFRDRIDRLPVLNVPLNFDAMDAFRSRMMKQSGIFYRFYQKLKRKRPEITVEEAEIAFIDYYKIDWGIISSTTKISPLLEKRVILSETDPSTGDRFVLLKNEPAENDL
ncbi:MAG TPA: hypothetical protein VJ521_04060, partial [Acidobacteriota bacterium]|nr:hypothetical protein [Acidobacteriota bacterium]